mmetsp:Transcript_22366/g.53090  ORF Transcript_22366/g.53090 Transcript_22366/m.53090 type:complete len:245 (-) Transcript_22366:107-841(-)
MKEMFCFRRSPGRPSRTVRATCVSHSLVTAKRSGVKALSMLAHARVAKVPPECVSSSTTLLRKEWLSPWKRKPACGTGNCCPSWPSSLLAEMVTTFSRGKARCTSAANCSPSHSDTSHPVISRSTEPSVRPSRACSRLAKAHAVIRLYECTGSSQSRICVRSTAGMSAMSSPTGSLSAAGLGRGWMRGLLSSRSSLLKSGGCLCWPPSMQVSTSNRFESFISFISFVSFGSRHADPGAQSSSSP